MNRSKDRTMPIARARVIPQSFLGVSVTMASLPTDQASPGDTFVLWFPFQLPDGYKIGGIDGPQAGSIDGYPAELLKDGPNFAVKVSKLPDIETATRLIAKLVTGLRWVALEQEIGVRYTDELQPVAYPDDPLAAAENIKGKFGEQSG